MEVEAPIGATTPALSLKYWKARGTAQPLRHLLEYLGLPYEDRVAECPAKYFTKEAEQVKKKCMSSNLPVLEDNGFMIAEPIVIAKYLCRKAGRGDLLGTTIPDQCCIDELFSKFAPHRNRLCDRMNSQMRGDQVPNSQIVGQCAEIMKGPYMQSLWKAMKRSKGGWFLGYLTIADFFIYETAFYISGLFPEQYSRFPELQVYKANFEALPAIGSYQQSSRERLEISVFPLGDLWKGNCKYR